MRPGTLFDPGVWFRALQGDPPDRDELLRWRLAPPRIVTREAVEAGRAAESVPSWDEDSAIPLDFVAKQFAVTPATVSQRCKRWGLPIVVYIVGRTGGGWQRQKRLPIEAYRVFKARAVRPLGEVEAEIRTRAAARRLRSASHAS
jgi:hypothetical protein